MFCFIFFSEKTKKSAFRFFLLIFFYCLTFSFQRRIRIQCLLTLHFKNKFWKEKWALNIVILHLNILSATLRLQTTWKFQDKFALGTCAPREGRHEPLPYSIKPPWLARQYEPPQYGIEPPPYGIEPPPYGIGLHHTASSLCYTDKEPPKWFFRTF